MTDTEANNDSDLLTGAVLESGTDDIPFVAYFDIIKEHTISFSNSITDYYLEDNTAVQDHISHAPLTITLSGLRGELAYTPSNADVLKQLKTASFVTTLRDTTLKLRALNMFLPAVSNPMALARNVVKYVTGSVKRYYGIYKSITNKNNALENFQGIEISQTNTKLQNVCENLLMLSNYNIPLVIDTPYRTFEDMYIESVTLTQGEVNYVTDIQVTLKQLRFAEVETVAPDEKVMSQYTAYQNTVDENNGKAGTRKSELAKMWDSNLGKV